MMSSSRVLSRLLAVAALSAFWVQQTDAFIYPSCTAGNATHCEQSNCGVNCTCTDQPSCQQSCFGSSCPLLHCSSADLCRQNTTSSAVEASHAKGRLVKQSCTGSTCKTMTCNATIGCQTTCDHGSRCESIRCHGNGSCEVDCTASKCKHVLCGPDLARCHIRCNAGAECNMACYAKSCRTTCHAGAISCNILYTTEKYVHPSGSFGEVLKTAPLLVFIMAVYVAVLSR